MKYELYIPVFLKGIRSLHIQEHLKVINCLIVNCEEGVCKVWIVLEVTFLEYSLYLQYPHYYPHDYLLEKVFIRFDTLPQKGWKTAFVIFAFCRY